MQQDDVDALVPGWQSSGLTSELIATLELSKRAARLHALFEQALRAELSVLGLTYAEFDVLAALFRVDPLHRLKPSDLARSLFLTSGGTTNVLNRLTSAGHIERTDNPEDARSRWVTLTPQGLALAVAAMEASGRAHETTMGTVPHETVRAAADALRDVLTSVRGAGAPHR